MASPTLQFKRGLFVNLPALRAGEPGFTTDRSDLYVGIGAGTTASNKFFGSSRYWTREDGSNSAELKLVSPNGNDGVSLRSPTNVGAGVTYTLPGPGGSPGHFLKLGNSGVLEWASVSSNATFDNATLTGVTTISSATINGGSINNTTIGLTTAAAGTFTQLNYSNSSTSGISTVGSLYVGTTKVLSTESGQITLSGIATLDATTKATLESTLKLDPNDFDSLNVTGIGTIGGAFFANGNVTLGDASGDTVTVKGTATFEQPIVGTISTATALQTARTISLSGDVVGEVLFDGTSNVSIAATIQPNSVALGGDTTGNYVATVAGTANQITVSGSGSETAAVTLSLPNDVVVGTSLSVPTVKTATIQHSNGTEALTIDSIGNVGVSTNLTVTGNLIVNGTTTQVNTTSLTVEDTLVELGMVDGSVPTSDVNRDLGLLFNYYTDAAKKAAVYWDDSTSRITFASDVSESNSVLTATTYATILAGGLEINNACTGGTDEVISCVGGELALSNIVIDGGSFV